MDKFLSWAGVFFVSLICIALGAFITGFLVKLIWNWIIIKLFGLAAITWLEGWGIAFLCGLLFKGSSVNTSK